MYMEKQKINEVGFFQMVLNLAVGFGMFYFFYYLQNSFQNVVEKTFKAKGTGDCSDDVIGELYGSKEFFKELTTIIMKEGGFKKFMEKMKVKDYEAGIFSWNDFDDEGFIKSFGRKSVDITKQILKTKSVRNIIKKYDCENKDSVKRVGNMIWMWVTSKNLENALRSALEAAGEKIEDKVNEQSTKLKSLIPNK